MRFSQPSPSENAAWLTERCQLINVAGGELGRLFHV